ncbi:aquaporin-10 isoform X2 [Numida meleagris]|uniref:aquaporin-10 isoform X2 n=1 Tax=Numida meleagris TaxID=8996 RepID=UPI000B3E0646|nr:aquaporin-10 isoform X2 [Numida meleagris]
MGAEPGAGCSRVPSPAADHAGRRGADGHQLRDQGEHHHLLTGGRAGRHGGHLHSGGGLWGSPEPGFLPRHVPAGAAPVVEVPHFRGRADLWVLHRRRSRLCSVLRYAEPAAGTWGGRTAWGAQLGAQLCPADAIWSYSNGTLTASGPRETASIFATYPAEHLSLPNGFLDQVLGTAVLIVGILAITDTRNRAVPRGLEPVAVALLVLAIEVSMGSNCGSPMNPARDLGPRLFTLAAGWGTEVFSRGSAWWWVPVVAPLVGAALGTGLYQLFVAFHHPEEEEDGGRERRQTKH